jgi:hypothetical protein
MRNGDANELLAFERVRILNVASGALHCLIGRRRVWLPREHIKGTLWCAGDRGRLFVRRWVALDRNLVPPAAAQVVRLSRQALRVLQPRRLRLLPPGGLTHGHQA